MEENNEREIREQITAAVDGELPQELLEALHRRMKSERGLRNQFEAERQLKAFLKKRLSRHTAPSHLRERIHDLVESQTIGQKQIDSSLVDIDTGRTGFMKQEEESTTDSRSPYRYVAMAAAALVLIVAAINQFKQTGISSERAFDVGEHSISHYAAHGYSMLPLAIAENSPVQAELLLEEHHGQQITIPELDNATFEGVAFEEFVAGLTVPVLEYRDTERTDNSVLIFTFPGTEQLEENGLAIHPDAVKKCTTQRSYFVQKVGSRHVVLWQWDRTWYAAVSDLSGDLLASRVVPFH